jgi:hypothetical protein
VVALKTKHLAIIVPAIFAVLIALAMVFGRWNAASGRRFSDLVGGGLSGAGRESGVGAGHGGGPSRTTEAGDDETIEHDASDRIVRGTTTFGNLAAWGVDMAAVGRLVGGKTGAPEATVRDWCRGRGIGFGQVKGSIQALVDAADN